VVVRSAFEFESCVDWWIVRSALAASGGNWHAIIWSQPSKEHWWLGKGLLWKVIVPMVTSPIAGFILGFVFMALLYVLLRNARPLRVNRFFGRAQMSVRARWVLCTARMTHKKRWGL